MITPLQQYQQHIQDGTIENNPVQATTIQYLNKIYHRLCKRQRIRNSNLGKLRRKIKPRPPIHGLYLWGSVGVGKTYLVNLFYHCLPTTKVRQHYHAFMQQIHQQLTEKQGNADPLSLIAKEIADRTVVLVLDEFLVTNIADAMILEKLLEALFAGGVCLITTGNTEPDKLYLNGLQRERFLPAIALIKQHTQVTHLDIKQDYRKLSQQQLRSYFSPAGEHTDQVLAHCFNQLIHQSQQPPKICTDDITLFSRTIPIHKQAGDVIWLEFAVICGRPRSAKDYLVLAKRYHTIIISNVPKLTDVSADLVISMIYLIDVLYDEHVRVIISAAVPIDQLYPQGRLRPRFERTESRLIEMQSPQYINSDSAE